MRVINSHYWFVTFCSQATVPKSRSNWHAFTNALEEAFKFYPHVCETVKERKSRVNDIYMRLDIDHSKNLILWKKDARKKDNQITVQTGRVHTGIDNREKQAREGAVWWSSRYTFRTSCQSDESILSFIDLPDLIRCNRCTD